MARRIANSPSGLSGPDLMTPLGSGSPLARCSARTEAGGFQVGFTSLETTWVSPMGVCQSILPMLTG